MKSLDEPFGDLARVSRSTAPARRRRVLAGSESGRRLEEVARLAADRQQLDALAAVLAR